MKVITQAQIEESVYQAASKMCFSIDDGAYKKILEARESETGLSRFALDDIIENVAIAKSKHIPVCQDTGIVVCFVELGNEIFIDGSLENAVNRAISRAYVDNYLRKSVVASPINRINTKDNTPAIFHVKLTQGDTLKITLCPKGAGSENMGKVKMLTPSDGIEGIERFVFDTVISAGGKACPPLIVGVGIGGDMEKCAILSKEALLCPIDEISCDEAIRLLEERLLNKLNAQNIGAMGLKGSALALKVKVLTYPCHIASLPVAVSLMCHAVRHVEVVL